jgi:hypothetical protein
MRFEVADAVGYTGHGVDFVAFFDCMHDMANPDLLWRIVADPRSGLVGALSSGTWCSGWREAINARSWSMEPWCQ